MISSQQTQGARSTSPPQDRKIIGLSAADINLIKMSNELNTDDLLGPLKMELYDALIQEKE